MSDKPKVLILNGSPREGGNNEIVERELTKTFEESGVETEVIRVGNKDIIGCQACSACLKLGKCVHDDIVNEIAAKFEKADGLVLISPVYYAAANSTLTACLDRLFYSAPFDKSMKVGAAIAIARRGGASSAFDQLNKYFGISGMPVAGSNYWNLVYGLRRGDAEGDEEGKQTVRVLAKNMSFLMKSIALGKEAYGLPEPEGKIYTNYMR